MKGNIIILLFLAGLFLSGSAQKYANYQVEVLGKGLWLIQAITGARQSTAYLVEGKKEALLIDACSGQEGLADVLKDLVGKKPVELALTHGHGDHSGGIQSGQSVWEISLSGNY